MTLQWLMTPIGIDHPEDLALERILVGLIIFFELINEWKKLIQTKMKFGVYASFYIFFLSVLIVDLLLKGYQSFASALFGIGLSVLYERFKKHFKMEEEYEQV
ncbi:hypothetical protein [Pseudalkalibacillus salsuginis]|uniref:hypothetical protein n=1 Tax=Pseudalkalibacillus salsuginis TaxID=2910972 RepID=UPI001F2CC2DF|nr:hypothetical protein [Pseudalkalibacillus salsuginis]MCF6409347.1 hypothetical protein [Pseudalkalibacillus salsuginis]